MMTTKGWILTMAGLWLAFATCLPLGPREHEMNDLIVGFVVVNIGLSTLHRRPTVAWTAGALGMWVFISAFIPPLVSGIGLFLNNILTGALIMGVGYVQVRNGKNATTTDRRVLSE